MLSGDIALLVSAPYEMPNAIADKAREIKKILFISIPSEIS